MWSVHWTLLEYSVKRRLVKVNGLPGTGFCNDRLQDRATKERRQPSDNYLHRMNFGRY